MNQNKYRSWLPPEYSEFSIPYAFQLLWRQNQDLYCFIILISILCDAPRRLGAAPQIELASGRTTTTSMKK
eukprot:5859033-Pleurochrysis_carterae.AAC.1